METEKHKFPDISKKVLEEILRIEMGYKGPTVPVDSCSAQASLQHWDEIRGKGRPNFELT